MNRPPAWVAAHMSLIEIDLVLRTAGRREAERTLQALHVHYAKDPQRLADQLLRAAEGES